VSQHLAVSASVSTSKDSLLQSYYDKSNANLTWTEFSNQINNTIIKDEKTIEEYNNITSREKKMEEFKKGLDDGAIQVEKVRTLLWTLTTSMFVVGKQKVLIEILLGLYFILLTRWNNWCLNI
jgi:hypothetical protein